MTARRNNTHLGTPCARLRRQSSVNPRLAVWRSAMNNPGRPKEPTRMRCSGMSRRCTSLFKYES